METDLLGLISTIHMQLADQRSFGTLDPDCIKLAGMASTAVDFSKSGIPVNMRDCPKHNRFRPDFMSPSPRVTMSGQGHLDLEENEIEENVFQELDAESRPMRYYESKKVLGHLFRAIDEEQFLMKMKRDRDERTPDSGRDTIGRAVLAYMKREAAKYGILYDHHADLAWGIRAG